MDWSKAQALPFFIKLREQYPRDSKKRFLDRFKKAVKEDEALKNMVLTDAGHSIFDDLYDEAVREGRVIPAALRKPS